MIDVDYLISSSTGSTIVKGSSERKSQTLALRWYAELGGVEA